MKKRVVLTGVGVVSPVGIGAEEFWENSSAAKSGITKLKRIKTNGFPTSLGAEIKDFDPTKFIKNNDYKNMDIASQFATAAASLAATDADFKNGTVLNDAGVAVGTTLGTISFILDQQDLLERGDYKSIHRHTGYMALHNSLSADISIELEAYGVSETISSACVSGLAALDYAIRKIRYDGYDIMIAGGAESAFRPLPYAGLNIIHVLTNEALRPFDERADGTVLGEGAAFFVVESFESAKKRNAKIYCEVLDTYFTCESSGHFNHENEPKQAVRALEKAIANSGINKKDISIINAHGLGLKGSDMFENKTYNMFFGKELCNKINFTSIKPYIGHPLAAASAFQIAYTAFMLKEKTILPTLNFEIPGDYCNLNIARDKKQEKRMKYALINANAFGGKCGACVLKAV